MILIQNGNVFTMEKPGCEVMDILVDAGKIIEMGKHLAVTGDATIIDASGKNIYPGFIDAHCHLGMEETAIGFEGNDVNEMSDPITPQMRAIDALNPMDETLQNAYAGGVTTVCSGPGSANVIGGTFCVYKTYGTCIDEMIVKYIRRKYNLLIGERMAEEAKIAIGCVYPQEEVKTFRVKGRNALTGLPQWADITSTEML